MRRACVESSATEFDTARACDKASTPAATMPRRPKSPPELSAADPMERAWSSFAWMARRMSRVRSDHTVVRTSSSCSRRSRRGNDSIDSQVPACSNCRAYCT
ncbi:hypothetical protein D7X99_02170 [Corallococcus sp. AB032C]|nr:hypothetical protein D7X99_02170 [Corallococcus sp. AB032C]